jgi:hypothetical protein
MIWTEKQGRKNAESARSGGAMRLREQGQWQSIGEYARIKHCCLNLFDLVSRDLESVCLYSAQSIPLFRVGGRQNLLPKKRFRLAIQRTTT